MENASFFNSQTFALVVLPLLIFLARICDVAIGTIRIIFVSRGHKFLAPLIGFFEVLIWLLALGKIMQNLTSPVCYIAYAGGFAAGNFIGIYIEEKLAVGTSVVRIITRKDATELIKGLNSAGYGVTSVAANGSTGQVHIVYTVIKRGDTEDVVGIIKKFNPKAFYSVEDARFVSEGIFPLRKSLYKGTEFNLFRIYRKGK